MRQLAVGVAILAVTVLAGWLPWFASPMDWRTPRTVEIDAVPIAHEAFHLHGPRVEHATAEFVGGLVLRSDDPDFGALSALRINDAGRVTSVSDTGFWFTGRLSRDEQGNPSGIDGARIAPLLDQKGNPFTQKWFSDAEGLTFIGSYAFVSTEQKVRLLRYPIAGDLLTAQSREFSVTGNLEDLPYNSGFEAIATLPRDHEHRGKLILLVETPQPDAETSRGFLWTEGEAAPLSVLQYGGFSITDADFLPNGDLLLLERKFSPARGAEMRVRRVAGDTIAPGAVLSGEIVLELDRNHQIDNSEGLATFKAADGTQRIGIISDDNRWPMQRTLYLEFVLRDGQAMAERRATKP